MANICIHEATTNQEARTWVGIVALGSNIYEAKNKTLDNLKKPPGPAKTGKGK